jgi:hypothetical protein
MTDAMLELLADIAALSPEDRILYPDPTGFLYPKDMPWELMRALGFTIPEEKDDKS